MNPALHHLLDFSFPLNVYGAMLQWSEGRVDYLHYGLFESLEEPIWQAQERASQRLWAQLPPPCRVLEVGIGLGQTLARLGQRGYHAVGLTPEPAQVAYAQAQHGGRLTVHTTRLEDYAPASERYDLLLLQESAQYIQPLALFEAADRLLDTGRATLVVMDEFALKRERDEDFGLHLLPHFKALAQRFGWTLVHEEDVTSAALLTVDVLQALTQRHGARVRQEIGLSDAELLGLDSSNARYAHNYRHGIFGYRVLRFERSEAPAIRPVVMDGHGSADAAVPSAMRQLFQRVFQRELGAAEWQWKYGQGRGHGLGLAARDGTLSAFYGGLTRPVQLFGQPALACQVCDVMINEGSHRSLVRQGPAHQVAATFLEAQIGWARPHAIGFGFPTDRALGVAEKLGLYARVDEMLQLRWPALVAPADVTGSVQAVELSSFDEAHPAWPATQALWARMALDLSASVLGVRDAPWLRYRYAQKPAAAYEVLWLRAPEAGDVDGSGRDGGAPGGLPLPGSSAAAASVGIAVFRRHATHLELLDVVAPTRYIPTLVRALRMEAARSAQGTAEGTASPLPVLAWVTASHAHLWTTTDDGAVHERLNLFVPANAYTPGVPPQALRDRWFLTAGDTDFR
jgi:SAM-dependent methyltransferase